MSFDRVGEVLDPVSGNADLQNTFKVILNKHYTTWRKLFGYKMLLSIISELRHDIRNINRHCI